MALARKKSSGKSRAKAKAQKSRFPTPITAIRNGDEDGNDATERQADWEPLLKTPMHPEYPCGHCVAISALTTILATEAAPPAEGIAVTSDAMTGVVRYISSWSTLSDEISVSRIYAGAHFRHSVEVGQALGKQVAEFALRGFLVPVHQSPCRLYLTSDIFRQQSRVRIASRWLGDFWCRRQRVCRLSLP